MKAVLKVLTGAGLLLVVFVITSLLLPANYRVTRSIVINALPARVYENIANFDNWGRWNFWDQRVGPSGVMTSEPSQGIGAWHQWKDEAYGRVKAVFTYEENRQSLYYRLLFNDHGIVAIGSFRLEPRGDDTQVIWSIGERVGINPLKRWFSLLFVLRAGRELGEALDKLKGVCETHAPLN